MKMKNLILMFAVLAFTILQSAVGAAEKRNVLFIVSDDLNCDLGCYGDKLVKSPNIDRLAERGVLFENAYCQYPVCNPSRSSFMTGCYPDQTGVLSNGGDLRKALPNVVTMPQLFQEHGYFVARVGKIFHYSVPNAIGTSSADDPASWQMVINPRGIDREIHDRIHTLQKGQFGGTLSWYKIKSRDEEHTDGIGATEAIKLLETHHPEKTGKPFFLAVGFYRPHTPYVAPSHWFDKYPLEQIDPVLEKTGDRDDIPLAALADRPGQRELTIEKRKEIIQAYYASISLMDAQVGRLLDTLDRLKLRENTVVVFISDHGYHLGHHGLWQKGDLFEGSARVPMIVSSPGMKNAGRKTRAMSELVDLYPTIADLCDLPKPDHLKGQSQVPALKDISHAGKDGAMTVAWSRGGRMHKEIRGKQIKGYTVRTSRYRYTEWGRGEYGTELYDYQADPDEFTNLAGAEEHAAIVAGMKKLLHRRVEYAQ
jgi:iduronate 2-sulfatase